MFDSPEGSIMTSAVHAYARGDRLTFDGWRVGLVLGTIPAGYVVATNDGHGHRENVHYLRINGKVAA